MTIRVDKTSTSLILLFLMQKNFHPLYAKDESLCFRGTTFIDDS
ncbi:hypothetical protein C1A50_2984 [Paenibacillus polymyxa]|nr:hypothetical protein C1A50_2984 [Paenibacillus polymyxa]